MRVFPITLPMDGQSVALIGAGAAAARKGALLARTRAKITHFAPAIEASNRSLFPEAARDWRFCDHWPDADELRLFRLVFVAVADATQAAQLAAAARQAGALVNVVDRPGLSDFYVPAIVERGEIVAAIATGGLAPSLARYARRLLEQALPQGLRHLGDLAARLETGLRAARPSPEARRRFWSTVLDGPIGARALAGDVDGAETLARAQWSAAAGEEAAGTREGGQSGGIVHLVGAGPGDPELLTLKALRLLQSADVIVYDRLVDPRILDLARRDAEFILAGKRAKAHAMAQDTINAILIAQARAGRVVVRLKGGDPFVFGRGGEELDALREAGIEATVTPGISAALACAAAVQAPLTHRDFAQSVTFVTGHAREDAGGAVDLDWPSLARANQTIAVYMGGMRAEDIAERLTKAGAPAQTPVLAIENGARPTQRTLSCRLDRLGAALGAFGPSGPVLLLIGETAGRSVLSGRGHHHDQAEESLRG